MGSPFNFSLYDLIYKSEILPDWAKIAFLIFFVLVCMIGPYILGSLNFAVIISKLKYHDDIRDYGSGNAGTTNMLRTYGKGAAIATLTLDMLKGVVSVFAGWLLLGGNLAVLENVFVSNFDAGYLAGLFCVLGHIFPCFYKFKGGKGFATVAIVCLCNSPFVFLILLLVFAIVVAGTKFVSLGSIMCMLLYPLLLNTLGVPLGAPKGFPILISIILMVLIIFMHRENIKRIANGTESKISFSKKKKEEKKEENDEQ